MASSPIQANVKLSVEEDALDAYKNFIANGGNLDQVLKSRGLPTASISNVSMKFGATAGEVTAYNKTMVKKLRSVFQSIQLVRNHQEEKSVETMTAIEALKQQLTNDKLSGEERQQCEHHMWALMAKARTEANCDMSRMKDALCRLAEMKILTSEKLLAAEEEDKMNVDADSTEGVYQRNNYGDVLRQALELYASAIPMFIGQPLQEAPELCGSKAAGKKYISQIMDKVAAQITMQTNEPTQSDAGSSGTDSPMESDEQWILAEIVSYDYHNKAYHVKDVFPEEKIKRRYVVERRKVIPLPKTIANPEVNSDALFPLKSRVLALYPQTTCFYPGYVDAVPEKYDESYTVVFDDKTYRSGYAPPMAIPQTFVLRTPHAI